MRAQMLVGNVLVTYDPSVVTVCPPHSAAGRLRWYCQPRPTRRLPLSLGVVGRW